MGRVFFNGSTIRQVLMPFDNAYAASGTLAVPTAFVQVRDLVLHRDIQQSSILILYRHLLVDTGIKNLWHRVLFLVVTKGAIMG